MAGPGEAQRVRVLANARDGSEPGDGRGSGRMGRERAGPGWAAAGRGARPGRAVGIATCVV